MLRRNSPVPTSSSWNCSEGYDTIVGERGSSLSGGQRQRIAIARALMTNPRILIFDEATSALDYESERAIQQNMKQIATGRTVFIIAHRLSTVRHADRIITIERGRIVEDGKHDELIRSNGRYAKLHYLQAGIHDVRSENHPVSQKEVLRRRDMSWLSCPRRSRSSRRRLRRSGGRSAHGDRFVLLRAGWAILWHAWILSPPRRAKSFQPGAPRSIQPFETGVVRAIHVRDGQSVKAGDVLIELDPTMTEAERDHLKSDLVSAGLDVARLRAALSERADPLDAFHPPEGASPVLIEMNRQFLISQIAEQQSQACRARSAAEAKGG